VTSESLPGVARLRERLAGFRYSLFRLETLQAYRGSSEDEAFAAYRADGTIPVTPELRSWCARVHQRVCDGCAVQRVHVVIEPVTEYMAFELASYAPNVDAGEDVRILRVEDGGVWPLDVPRQDFWLIDASELWSMAYADDGAWLGAEPVRATDRILAACRARDAALAQAQSWVRYMQRAGV
jgi:hypothetical protein